MIQVSQLVLIWQCPLILMMALGFNIRSEAAERLLRFREPPHSYFEHQPNDPLAQLHRRVESGEVQLDSSSDQALLVSLMRELHIPESSQLLVFSASSLQSEIINPRNPRALYFNDEVYIGWVPGGRVEVAAIDPVMGPIFYVYERVSPNRVPTPERSTRCFNCHAGAATQYVPGLIAESLLVTMAGSSLQTFRHDEQGHQIPLENRFGGWLLTGQHGLKNHHGNVVGQSDAGRIVRFDASAGRFSDLARHLRASSDILPHLIHEHQIGFENRLFQASYLLRQRLHEGDGRLTREAQTEMIQRANDLAKYILFADEAPLPAGGIEGDPDYVRDFSRNKKVASTGNSLKDLELRTRLFKLRCSFMIHTPSWEKAPSMLKDWVYRRMAQDLRTEGDGTESSNLPRDERVAIRQLIAETVADLPVWWR